MGKIIIEVDDALLEAVGEKGIVSMTRRAFDDYADSESFITAKIDAVMKRVALAKAISHPSKSYHGSTIKVEK